MTHSLRILHTSDWHLGHTLRGQSRAYEHRRFLAWLLERLDEERVDALLVAGDVFHTSNPSAEALRMFYDFLGDVRRKLPALDVVVIGGNHDSASRLDAPESLFASQGVRVIGGLAHRDDPARALVPLHREGELAGWVAAVPFLRRTDLDGAVEREAGHAAAVRAAYDRVVSLADARRSAQQPIVAMGHLTMMDAQLSADSERDTTRGGQESLPCDLFSDAIAYAALGHLHLAQAVAPRVRYSGSPIPMSMSEESYEHQVLVADFEGANLEDVRALRIPRTVPMIRLHTKAPLSLDQTLASLRALDVMERPLAERPFLEVAVRLDRPEPNLRAKILEALGDKQARLIKITSHRSESLGQCLGDRVVERELSDLEPLDVFQMLHEQKHGAPPAEPLLQTFRELQSELHAS